MKKMQKILAQISALFLFTSVVLFTSCDQLSSKVDNTVEKIETEIIDEALAKMGDNFIPSSVDADTNSITLPKAIPDYESVKLSWTSSDSTIIDATTGKVNHKTGTGSDKVTLTATLSFDGKTRTKAYEVSVAQKQDILEDAYASLSDDLILSFVTGNSITLPKNVPGYSDVKITWTSSNSEIINVSTGTVTHQEGTGDDVVKLTATLAYGGKTKTKEYSVKVTQKDKELTDAEILEAAKSEVVINYSGENFFEKLDIPKTVVVNGKTIDISFAIAADSVGAKLDLNENVEIEKDIIEQTAKITLTLAYNGKSATKDVSITVPAATEFIYYGYDYSSGELRQTETITFDPSTKTLTREASWIGYAGTGTQYSYEVLGNHKIKVTTTKVKSRGKWSTLEEMAEEYTSMYTEMMNLMTNPPSTYSELYNTAKVIYESMGGDTEGYLSKEEFLKHIGASEDDDAAKQAQVIDDYMSAYTEEMGLSETYSIDDLIADEIENIIGSYPKNAVYSYQFWDQKDNTKSYPNGASIKFEYQFDNTKTWYNQFGRFSYFDNNTYDSFTVYSKSSYVNIKGEEYNGKWDKNYTTFTATSDSHDNPLSKTFSITVTDNKDGTVTISGGILTEPVKLNFEGSSLQ